MAIWRARIVVNRLAGLFRQFESNRSARLVLTYRGSVERIIGGCDVLNLQDDNVAAAQLAIDREIKTSQDRVFAPSIWSFVRIDGTCFGRSGGFGPISLLLFQGTRVREFVLMLASSCIVILLRFRG